MLAVENKSYEAVEVCSENWPERSKYYTILLK
jgi:hypothetical protein